jgi:hypothetical protein
VCIVNVKQGDTAIVIDSSDPENLGIICEVKRFLGTVYPRGGVCINAWHVVSNGRPFVVDGKRMLECGTTDASLRPISGLPDADSTDERSPVEQLEPELA